VRELARARDIVGLQEICNADIDASTEAVYELIALVDSAEAIALCKRLEKNDRLWIAAYDAITAREKKGIITYVKEVARSSDPWRRSLSYILCKRARWPDLVDLAKKDVDDQTKISFPNQPEDEKTLGQIAKKYIVSLAEPR
jgi:hypothetical protein